MNNGIADGGYRRLLDGQKALASESLQEKYAAQLGRASPEEKTEIYQRMAEESESREKMLNHRPSGKSLW